MKTENIDKSITKIVWLQHEYFDTSTLIVVYTKCIRKLEVLKAYDNMYILFLKIEIHLTAQSWSTPLTLLTLRKHSKHNTYQTSKKKVKLVVQTFDVGELFFFYFLQVHSVKIVWFSFHETVLCDEKLRVLQNFFFVVSRHLEIKNKQMTKVTNNPPTIFTL